MVMVPLLVKAVHLSPFCTMFVWYVTGIGSTVGVPSVIGLAS